MRRTQGAAARTSAHHGPAGAAAPTINHAFLEALDHGLENAVTQANAFLVTLDEKVQAWVALMEADGEDTDTPYNAMKLPHELIGRLTGPDGVAGAKMQDLIDLDDWICDVASESFPQEWQAHHARLDAGEDIQTSLAQFAEEIGDSETAAGPAAHLIGRVQYLERKATRHVGGSASGMLLASLCGIVAILAGLATFIGLGMLVIEGFPMDILVQTGIFGGITTVFGLAACGGVRIQERFSEGRFNPDKLRKKHPERAGQLDEIEAAASDAAWSISRISALTGPAAAEAREIKRAKQSRVDELKLG